MNPERPAPEPGLHGFPLEPPTSASDDHRRESIPTKPGFARSSVDGLVAYGPESATTKDGTKLVRVVMLEHRASNHPRPQTILFSGPLADWASAHLRPGVALQASGFESPGQLPGLWATKARSNDLSPVAGEIIVNNAPDPAAIRAAFPTRVLPPPSMSTPTSFEGALREPVLRCEIPDKMSAEAAQALKTPPTALRDLDLRPGYAAWLPTSLADGLLEWAGSNRIPMHVERSRSYENLLPDHSVSDRLVKQGIEPETANSPHFRNTLHANQWGELFALQKGPQGACGITRVSMEAGKPGHIAAGDAGLWVSNPVGRRDEKLVVVDSPLDALAYHQLHPTEKVRYVATNTTNLSESQKQSLGSLVKAMAAHNHDTMPHVIVASSRDAEGQRFTRQVMDACGPSIAPRRESPYSGRDWAGALELKERDLVRAMGGPLRRQAHGMTVR